MLGMAGSTRKKALVDPEFLIYSKGTSPLLGPDTGDGVSTI